MSEPIIPDDVVGAFQIEGEPVRGRIIRLGPAIDQILRAHAYPEPVANLLGEACALAALVGSNLKFDGRLIVEARGAGPVRYVVADYDTSGGLRGYCRFDPEEVEAVSHGFQRPGAKTLLGEGVFMMTVDQGSDMDRYQGVTAIEGETLALCAEQYFLQSEQTPTRIRLAVGQEGEMPWRGGGMLVQYIAGDDARGDTLEAWVRTQAFFETIGEDELLDLDLSSNTLLFRLFHEDGVRVFGSKPLRAFCRCNQERIETVLRSFDAADREDMVEPDGKIHVTCEYCSRVYAIAPETVAA
ncbi:Hsp33 family molecular chaperone [Phenylobacterium kunshanense]|uniref:Hsp33 family molecular chaperone n=1 Tax=Phenylobacterium kunshanense TaxID=1445034 RepID=A0A328BEI4_9CAUL|nr:Hsp33 family molecular chaperone [Phenylobacterium kunshanense]RAK64851.1 Hsp33 family molecular chaperone [Phenylobacterium kunshanense]